MPSTLGGKRAVLVVCVLAASDLLMQGCMRNDAAPQRDASATSEPDSSAPSVRGSGAAPGSMTPVDEGTFGTLKKIAKHGGQHSCQHASSYIERPAMLSSTQWTESAPTQVRLRIAGAEPRRQLRYELVPGTAERAKIWLGFNDRPSFYEIVAGPVMAEGSGWALDLAAEFGALPWNSPSDPGIPVPCQPLTTCGQIHLNAQGNIGQLNLSERCEPARYFSLAKPGFGSRTNLRFAPFRFVAPFPDEPVGPGAQWVASEKVGPGAATTGQATFTLIELTTTSALLGYHLPAPTAAVFTDVVRRQHGKVKPWPVFGIARVLFGKLLPVAWLNYSVSTMSVESDSSRERSALFQSLQGALATGNETIQIASVQGLQALGDQRAIEVVLGVKGTGSAALDAAIDAALEALVGKTRGTADWYNATMLRYCAEFSHARALPLLDQAIKLSIHPNANLGSLHALRSLIRRDENDLQGARSDLRLALRLAPSDPDVSLVAAWWYSTTTLDGERDGKRALSLLTERVQQRSRYQLFQRVRAAALAELQRFDEAHEAQRASMRSLKGSCPACSRPGLGEIENGTNQARADAYRAHLPWRGNLIPSEYTGCLGFLRPEADF